MIQKLNLYIAASLAGLDKLVEKTSYGRKLNMLCRASNTLYQKAIQLHDTNPVDEEMLYIYCVRYLNLVNTIKAQVKDDTFHQTRFSKPISIINNLKRICEGSLSDRYSHAIIPIHPKENFVVEAIANLDVSTKPSTIMSLIKDDDMFVNCDVLYKLMQDQDIKLLIIDARSSKDYQESPIKYKCLMNIPDEIIRKGLSTNTLQQKLSVDNAEIFKTRHTFDLIVLLDTDSTRISYLSSKLENLRTILIEWDVDQTYQTLPVVLEGGIHALVDNYPTVVVNPTKVFNKFFNNLDELMSEIDYPDIHISVENPAEPVVVDLTQPVTTDEAVNEIGTATKKKTVNYRIPSTLLENILTVAVHQLQVEEGLLKSIETRLELIKALASNTADAEEIASQLKHVGREIYKTESYKIQLNERRNLLDADYIRVKTDDAERLLADIIAEIADLDNKRVLQYKKRKHILSSSEVLQRQVNSSLEDMRMRRRVAPRIPDRKFKPHYNNRIQQVIIDTCSESGINGLTNIRNTCYMNSLIQCLRFCPMFLFYFTTTRFKPDLRMTYHLSVLLKKLWQEQKVALCPNNFYAEVCRQDNYVKGYANGRHEDVHEFYLYLMKALHTEMSHELDPDFRECTAKLRDWHKNFENKDSFISRNFYYQVELVTTCSGCKKSVIKYDYGNTLFITLPSSGNSINLSESVKEFIVVTPEEQENCKFCLKCEQRMVLKKRVSYYPSILAINIVRYEFSRSEQCVIRRNNECFFQEEIFFGRQRYNLNSVSLHTGNRNSGHYTALCQHPLDKQPRWIEFNDEYTHFVHTDDPNFRIRCYMLFYSMDRNADDVNKNFFQHE